MKRLVIYFLLGRQFIGEVHTEIHYWMKIIEQVCFYWLVSFKKFPVMIFHDAYPILF